MSEPITFTEDEINKLKELQTSYSEKQVQLGQLHVQKLLAEQQLDAIQQQTLDVEKQYVANMQICPVGRFRPAGSPLESSIGIHRQVVG